MFKEDLTNDELKKVLKDYREKMILENQEKEKIKNNIDNYFKVYEKNVEYMDKTMNLYKHNIKSADVKNNINPLKKDMYGKMICSIYGHDPERKYDGSIKEEDGLCTCKLCGKKYSLSDISKKSK